MLKIPPRARRSPPPARLQEGVVLIIALIVLVAMTLGGLALIRSTDLANIIAGNLAFRQAATHSGDQGIEAAFSWLQANPSLLNNDSAIDGYSANGNNATRSPATGITWEAYWNTLPAARIRTLPTDGAGNTVSYIIDRLCANAGSPTGGANCSSSPAGSVAGGQNEEGGEKPINTPSGIYYRITVRIAGPRNTTSFVQAMVTL